ncbi:phosphate/phosphite/phosphonate ABC transporter substrate-binding protein [uncultured Thiodictyon sp.]|uniref:phosphate/phosphite/phosphonate ABC transporter substrate-binding protein n=1 Tax=uncultured Thiodictyon sp. TaxID=1846217 RepID=UPI0025D550C1|nr:phosphate/phosphite/phosphonate ABC transporter substrate-binding protein [uncultured Thiodictyon sp.]
MPTFRNIGGFRPLWCLVLLALVVGRALADEPKVLIFSSYATERPSEEIRKMEPFRQAIERRLRARGRNVRVEVRIFATYEEGVHAIVSGEVDFSRLGPASYVIAKERNPDLSLLAVEAHNGKKDFSGLIVVAKDSSIQSLADLRGKTFAFGDPASTTGRYLPQAELTKAGITAKDLASYEYLGRHDKVVFAVASGTYDAGASNEGTVQKYAAERGLRELARFPSPTQAWVARSGLDAKVTAALRRTLLSLTGPALDYVDRNGFLPATDSDYDELRRRIAVARGFGG